MKICSECNVQMIENAKLVGQHPFELGADGKSKIYVSGINMAGRKHLKASVCPNCGKVELYIDINDSIE